MHEGGQHEHRADDADRDVPGDDFLPEHVGKTQQQCQCADFAHGAGTVGMVAEEEVERRGQLVEHGGVATLDGLLHDGQGGSAGLGVEIAGELTHLRPCSHLCGEGHQQGGTTHQCGVEEVIAQAAEGHLTDADGKEGTDDDNPDRQVGRQVEAEQQAGQHGRAVADGRTLVMKHELIDGPLEADACCNARSADDGRAESEEIERHEQRRQQGDDDAVHVALDGVCSMSVGR